MKKILILSLSLLFMVAAMAKKQSRAIPELLKGIEYQISIGHYEESLRNLEIVINMGEICSRVYFLKGVVHEKLNQKELAKKSYEKATYYLRKELLITPADSLLNDTKTKLKFSVRQISTQCKSP